MFNKSGWQSLRRQGRSFSWVKFLICWGSFYWMFTSVRLHCTGLHFDRACGCTHSPAAALTFFPPQCRCHWMIAASLCKWFGWLNPAYVPLVHQRDPFRSGQCREWRVSTCLWLFWDMGSSIADLVYGRVIVLEVEPRSFFYGTFPWFSAMYPEQFGPWIFW